MCKILIQIGCNNGDDHVFQHVKSGNVDYDRVILIDANPKCIEIAKKQYNEVENVEFFNFAITSSEEEEVDIYLPQDNETHMCASVSREHLYSHCKHNNIYSIKVPAITINGLLDFLGLIKIDRLHIDTEGLDVQILQTLNFDKFDIRYIEFEYIHSDGTSSFGGQKLDNLKEKLLNLGYELNSEEFNVIASKLNV